MSDAEIIPGGMKPTPTAYLQAARRVEAGKLPHLRPLRVAVLSTVSAQVLKPFLIVECARRGWRVDLWFAPFGQLEEQVLDPGSALYAQLPDTIFLFVRFEEFTAFPAASLLDSPSAAVQAEDLGKRWRVLLEGIRRFTASPVLIANFSPPQRLIAGLADPALTLSQTAWVQRANEALAHVASEVPAAYVFDYARLATEYGLRAWYDNRLFALARQPWTVEAQIVIARGAARMLRAIWVPPAKCLVLDADNTLWGGVLGEDGFGGIALGDDYPGNVFKSFQKYLRTLQTRGVLLALASKNDEAEVLDVLARHPDGVLRREDFAAVRINWCDKSVNLQEIAAELNLGIDSLVFFDDSPFEREEVRRQLSTVTVLEVPTEPLEFIDAIESSGAFDQLKIAPEDQQRTRFYQENFARAAASHIAGSADDFIESLQLVATIGYVGPETLPRVAQLLAKTNQFNLTTRRHGAGEIATMIEAGAVALWLRLSDRFGDHGLVGAALARKGENGAWIVDSLLLSCRVIGRRAEEALLAQLAVCVMAHGGRELIGEFLPTGRNDLVADFYSQHGFTACGLHVWRRNLSTDPIPFPPALSIRFHD